MRILYINNTGGGFARHEEVRDGTTVGQFFAQQFPGAQALDYKIRVRNPRHDGGVVAEHVLLDGDQVSIIPRKVAGA